MKKDKPAAPKSTGSSIARCDCKTSKTGSAQSAKFQDERYGQGMRVITSSPTGSKRHCTVCGRAH